MDEEKKMFPRVGARNVRVVGYKNSFVEKGKNCYCPACGGGPMDGVTGVCMETETDSDNSFGFNTPSEFNVNSFNINGNEMPDYVPAAGDPSICCYCAELLTYQEESDGSMSLRLFTRSEISRAKDNPDSWHGLMKMKEFVESGIERARIMGDKRYAGKSTKYTV